MTSNTLSLSAADRTDQKREALTRMNLPKALCTPGNTNILPRRSDGSDEAGGESVSQSPLKDQAFSTFLDQNPPFELPTEIEGPGQNWMSHHQIPRLDGDQAERCDGNLPFASRLVASRMEIDRAVAHGALSKPPNFSYFSPLNCIS
jgi:hypothetical protein